MQKKNISRSNGDRIAVGDLMVAQLGARGALLNLHIRLFRLYPESNGEVGILAGREIFMTKPHHRGDKALFMGSAAALVKVGVAAAISNTRKTCILRQELQTKQRRWVARGTGGGAELVSEVLQQLQLTDQHQVQPTSSQTTVS